MWKKAGWYGLCNFFFGLKKIFWFLVLPFFFISGVADTVQTFKLFHIPEWLENHFYPANVSIIIIQSTMHSFSSLVHRRSYHSLHWGHFGEYVCRDIAPEGATVEESAKNLDEITDLALELQNKTGVKLLWATCNLFSSPRWVKRGSAVLNGY